jgi:hypothetical protein
MKFSFVIQECDFCQPPFVRPTMQTAAVVTSPISILDLIIHFELDQEWPKGVRLLQRRKPDRSHIIAYLLVI